jgi:hypothetical protein
MLKEERNIANIFFPVEHISAEKGNKAFEDCQEGLLVGFNFEGFVFVIVAVVPLQSIKSSDGSHESLPEKLHKIIREKKFSAFNRHCAGELIILGVIEKNSQEHSSETQPLSLQRDLLEFKANQNIWLNIQMQRHSKASCQEPRLALKDLIVCEYKYKVIPHFIYYPRLS